MALPLMERAKGIYRQFVSANGYHHPHWDNFLGYYRRMREAAGLTKDQLIKGGPKRM